MKFAFAVALPILLFNLPGCKPQEPSCSSNEAQHLLKSAISEPQGSQEIADYTAEIDINPSHLVPSGLATDPGSALCLGHIDIAANQSRDRPAKEFDVGYKIKQEGNAYSIDIIVPKGY